MRFNKDVNYKMYLISDRDILKDRDLLVSLEEAILGGVSVIQLREKDSTSLEFYEIGIRVKKLTKKYDIPLIINDRLDIALAVDADGVHLGQSDLPAVENIQSEIEDLCRWMNKERKKYHPVDFAAHLHKKFVFIHPFKEKNVTKRSA